MEQNSKTKVATFRFSVIGDFVNGRIFARGEKERLLEEKANTQWEIPGSQRRRISRQTILDWIRRYRNGGCCLEALMPKTRKDKGDYRRLAARLRSDVKSLKQENPGLRLPAIIRQLKKKAMIAETDHLNMSSLYRFLKNEQLHITKASAVDRRRFEAAHPNELWQSDVMHGPYIKESARKRKSYLIAIIDDHSRLIVHAEFYLNEQLTSLMDCMKKAFLRRGLCQTLYIDNGACYRADHLMQIAANLAVSIKHSRPYTPQGRGKIEKWFRNVRDNFISCVKRGTLSDLNNALWAWVETYNQSVHSTTQETPLSRFRRNMRCVRPSPSNMEDYFRKTVTRTVKKDRTFQLESHLFEAPLGLVGRKIAVKYHPHDLKTVEVFLNEISFGEASWASPQVNAKVGRDWQSSDQSRKIHSSENKPVVPLSESKQSVLKADDHRSKVPTGQLPLGDNYKKPGGES